MILLVCLSFVGIAYGQAFDSLNVSFVGNWPFGSSYAVAYDSVRNLVFLGSGGGVYILDGSDPANLLKLSDAIRTRSLVSALFYDASSQNLYVLYGKGPSYVEAGLEIWDVSTPASPVKVGSYYTPSPQDVYVSGSYAYIADLNSLQVIDVSTPSNPQKVGDWEIPDGPDAARGVYVQFPYAYVACNYGLRVLDVSIPSNPQEAGYYETADRARDVYVSGPYAYVVGTGNGYLSVIDVSTPSNPQEVGFLETLSWAWSVCVSGFCAYVACWAGLSVIDVSTLPIPRR